MCYFVHQPIVPDIGSNPVCRDCGDHERRKLAKVMIRESLLTKIGFALLGRPPTMRVGEECAWLHGANWNKNGSLSKPGFLFITSKGRIIWRSARHDFPRDEWSCLAADIESVEIVAGSTAAKAAAPFAAKLRTLCVISLTDGDTREVFPASVQEAVAAELVRHRSGGNNNARTN